MKMLYRDNEILIFDEPTAVLTPYETSELLDIMKEFVNERKSILFITYKLNEIMQVADRCTVLRKGKYIGTVDIKDTNVNELSNMMVGRSVNLVVDKSQSKPKDLVLEVKGITIIGNKQKTDIVHNVSFNVKAGEIVCIAGIDGNGQTEFIRALTGLNKIKYGNIYLKGKDITYKSIRARNTSGISHIPEDRHRHGLVLDYSLEKNLVLQNYFENRFHNMGFIRFDEVRKYSNELIERFDVRSGQGYEMLIRRFADDSGHTAQEFYTNRIVVHLMTEILKQNQTNQYMILR